MDTFSIFSQSYIALACQVKLLITDCFLSYPQDPCFSDLCANGGSCTESEDYFVCNCLLSIRDLPYIDGRCNVGEYLI